MRDFATREIERVGRDYSKPTLNREKRYMRSRKKGVKVYIIAISIIVINLINIF